MMVSKRNKVVLENNVVKKTFIEGDINQEIFVYKRLNDYQVDCAKMIGVKNDTLILSYLPGETLLECFIKCEELKISMQNYLQYWTIYMDKFYKAMAGYRFNDVNYANFIIQKDKIVAVDFESVEKGNMYEDVCAFICFGLYYKPIETEYKKNQLLLWFKKHYIHLISKEEWITKLEQALFELNIRRKTTYTMDWNFLF